MRFMISAWGDVTFLQGCVSSNLGRQETSCKLGSLTSLTLSPLLDGEDRNEGTQHDRRTVGQWIEEGKYVLYLVSRTACKVGLSCGGIFFLLCAVFWVGFRKRVCGLASRS